jgi:hypothetical protein
MTTPDTDPQDYRFFLRTDVPWTHLPPTQADITGAAEEGVQAARLGRSFRDDCPYLFNRFSRMTYAEFNGTQRPLMDAWFKGWHYTRRFELQAKATDRRQVATPAGPIAEDFKPDSSGATIVRAS